MPSRYLTLGQTLGFPGSSAGKESACNAADPSSIPGSGRSPGEGMCYPLQYFWASLVAQKVKNPPAMQEIQVQSQGWEDPLEEGMATHWASLVVQMVKILPAMQKTQVPSLKKGLTTHSRILARRMPWTEELEGYSPGGRKESDTTE